MNQQATIFFRDPNGLQVTLPMASVPAYFAGLLWQCAYHGVDPGQVFDFLLLGDQAYLISAPEQEGAPAVYLLMMQSQPPGYYFSPPFQDYLGRWWRQIEVQTS